MSHHHFHSWLLLFVLLISACGPFGAIPLYAEQGDANETVTIEVVGVYRDPDWKHARDNLKELLGQPKNFSFSASGNRLRVEAWPIADIEAVVEAIQFDSKIDVDGQRIRVIFDEAKQVPGPAKEYTNQFFSQAPVDLLGPALREHDGDLIAALRSIRATIKVQGGELVEVKLPSSKTTDETLAHFAGLMTLKKLDLSMCRDVTDEGAGHLKKLTGLEELDLFGTLIGNTGQSHLRNLTNLRRLSLSGVGTEEGLRHLRDLTNLESLRVGYGLGYPVTVDGLSHLRGLTKLKQLRLDGCEISDDSLEVISLFRDLENLDMQDGRMSDEGLARLSGLIKLKRLSLKGCQRIGDPGMAHLRELVNMTALDVADTMLTDASVIRLAERLPHLSYLNLSGTNINDGSLQPIRSLKQLYSLSLSDTAITDAGIQALPQLPRLNQLSINRTAIGDAAIAHIASFPHLQNVWISDTKVTDVALEHLGKMAGLRVLKLDHTGITDAGMKHLAQLKELREIDVTDTAVTESGMKHLSACPKLYQIYADDSQASYEAIRQILSK